MSRTIVLIFTLALATRSILGQPAAVTRIDVTSIGVYTRDLVGKNVAKNTPVGPPNEIAGWTFSTAGTAVQARLGSQFGFEYRIVGTPKDAPVTLRYVTIFPAGGMRDPVSHAIISRSEFADDFPVGTLQLKGYRFDHDWELVSGTWVQQIWFGNKKMAEATFTVTK